MNMQDKQPLALPVSIVVLGVCVLLSSVVLAVGWNIAARQETLVKVGNNQPVRLQMSGMPSSLSLNVPRQPLRLQMDGSQSLTLKSSRGVDLWGDREPLRIKHTVDAPLEMELRETPRAGKPSATATPRVEKPKQNGTPPTEKPLGDLFAPKKNP